MAESTRTGLIKEFTAADGYVWQYRSFVPVGTPLAHVVCVHGIQSHGGWYEHSCRRLNEAGFAVSLLDRRGAGLNQQERGDAPGFRRLLDDIAEYVQSLRSEVKRIFIVGISWGGKLALALPCRHPGVVDGVVLICPGLCPQVRPTFRERLRIFWSRLVAPRRLFPIPLNDPELFTANLARQQFIRDDPLSLRQATARFLIDSVRLDGYLRFMAKRVRQPLLLLLAEHDRIIDNTRTRRYVERLRMADKTIREYACAHHTLEFELDPEPFINDIQAWLRQHV